MIVREFASRFSEHSNIGIVEVPTGTDSIEKEPDFDSGAGAFAKGVSELMTNFVRIQDISRKVNCVSGGANRLQHRREIFVSVAQQFDLVACDRQGIAKRKSG